MGIIKRMFNTVKNLLKHGRDAAVSFALKKVTGNLIKEYGEMLKFSIDSVNNNIVLDILLKGEKESLEVKIINYTIEKDEDGETAYLKFERVETSREWMNILIKNYLPKMLEDNAVELPAEYANILKIVM